MEKRFIYADNAATTRVSNKAMEAMLPWQQKYFGNASQPYSFSREVKRALRESRESIAKCIGANPEEIYFTSGGTESNNWVIKNACLQSRGREGIVTSSFEHHAVLRPCLFEREYRNRTVSFVPVSRDGSIDRSVLNDVISWTDGLVSIMLINNEIGAVQDIKALSEVAHKRGCLFHTDAVQAIGHIPIDVRKLNIDFLSASAHKFNGPKGIGFLYIKKGNALPGLIVGGGQESTLRSGTENIASIVGMATALKENCQRLEQTYDALKIYRASILNSLNQKGLEYTCNSPASGYPGIISLSFKGQDGEAILHRMDLLGICISTGSACNTKETEVSHVLKAIGAEDAYARGTIRISLGHENTLEEVQIIASSLIKILMP